MIKQYNNYFKKLTKFQKFIHFFVVSFFLIITTIFPFLLLIFVLGLLFFGLVVVINNNKFTKRAIGNGVIFGGRGKGKGLLLNKRINTDRNEKHYCNVPYNHKTEILNIKEYIDSIKPNTILNFINDKVEIVKKVEKFEGVNVYWDDISIYAPNHMDNELKRIYPSLSALLPINRHLYNAHMIITVQDVERPYKLLRELQTDFAIKAVKTNGWGYFWQAIPFLNMMVSTKYIYYENTNSASNGLLPFEAKALINEGLKHGYLTSGQATKEQFEATNGLIRYGTVWQLKKNINYDTRYFHQVVFGRPSGEATSNGLVSVKETARGEAEQRSVAK